MNNYNQAFVDGVFERNKITIEVLDRRVFNEIAKKKSPKIELLLAISDSIKLLFDNLYSLSEQVFLINNSLKKKYSISDTTYSKFVNTYMKEDYLEYQKNRYFASQYSSIKETISNFSTPELQFINLNFSGKVNRYVTLNLTLDDYIVFLNKYYYKEEERYFKKEVNRTLTKKELNISPSGGDKYTKIKITPDDIIKISDLKKEDPASAAPVKKMVSNVKPTSTTKTKVQVNNIKDRNELRNEFGNFELKPIAGINLDNVPETFKVIEDLDLLPDEVNNKDFKFGKINLNKNCFEEEYAYFPHRMFMQFVDPNTYGLKDGLLIITGITREKKYRNGYLFFRFYKGTFYLIEHFRLVSNPTISRDLSNWINDNRTRELHEIENQFYEKYSNGKNVDD